MSSAEYPCRCCVNFLLTLGLSALFLWLSLRTSDPTFSIEQFSLPALNTTATDPTITTNTNITFLLKLNNPNKDKGIFYDAVDLAFFLVNESDRKQDTLVANYTVPGFYQGHKKSAKKNGNATTREVDWADLVAENRTLTVFRVDLATAVRFKIMFWKTKRHPLAAAGEVKVDGSGARVKAKKGVKLKSAAEPLLGGGSGWSLGFGVVVNFFILGLLNFG